GNYATNAQFTNVCIPGTSSPNGIIAAGWDDLQNTSAPDSGVYTGVTGTAPNRTFTVEWCNVKHFTDNYQPVTNTFELQMEEATGDIYLVYPTLNGRGDGRESTTAVDNRRSTVGKQHQRNGRHPT